jgi:chromosome segregation ATPase
MRLVRLEVWNWRGLDHATLADLAPDLNLVVGPNESGKSRLFEALRFALFERYKGESEDKKRLRTWGGSESPAVEVHFEAQGRAWKLHKRFLKGASARLEGPGTNLTDEDAEDKLRQLWGTREIKGRKDVEQFLGLWPLLWVQQGRAGVAPHADLNDDTRGRLGDALTVQVHEVAAGRIGQRVLERAEAERVRYWTSIGKERGELLLARERRSAAEAALEQRTARREQAHATADELERTLTTLADGEARLVAQRVLVERASSRVALAHDRAEALRTRELEARTLHSDRELWRQRARERAQLDADVTAAAREIAEREALLARLEATTGALDADRARAKTESDEATAALSLAKAASLRAERRERRAALVGQAETARHALAEATAHRARLQAIEEELRRLPVSDAQMKALRRARETWTRAHASLAAAAARVTLRALQPLVIDGEPLARGAEREWRLDEATAILIEGIAELHVSPAGAELHRLRDAERDAREILDALLATLGASSVADAEDLHRRRIELDAERKHPEGALAQLGVGGVERLEASLRSILRELEGQHQDLEPTAAPDARVVLAKAEEALHAGRVARDVLEREVARVFAEREVARTLLDDARARQASAVSRLEALGSRESLAASVETADRAWTKAEDLAEALRTELRRKGDLDAATDRDREQKALANLEAAHRASLDRRIALEASVRHFGAEAIHEEVLQAAAELDAATRDLERVSRRAAAASALALALTAARREVQEQLVAPVREKVQPYLQGLLPDTQLDMGEGWTVNGLRSGDRVEDFDALSGGAKEQVGLLVRLGLAEVLGQGEPLPVVLDDCLVNTDPERQQDMLRLLYRASKKQQILLFSCHDVAFDRLGATRRYDLPARRAR